MAATAGFLTALALAGASPAMAATAPPEPAVTGGGHVFSVKDFGATGDGVANDTPAVDAAIVAANAAGWGVVRFPAGTYLAGGSIHLRSNVTLRLDAGATLLGAPGGYDVPEPNP